MRARRRGRGDESAPGARDRHGFLGASLLALAGSALRAPGRWLAGSLFVLLAAALALPSLEIRTDGASLELPDDPVFRASGADEAAFGDGDQVVVLLQQRAGGPAVATPAGLAVLADLHERFRHLPGVRAGAIRSLASVLDVRSEEDALTAEPFLTDIPQGAAELDRWLLRLRSQPITEAVFLSADGTAAAFYLPAAERADRAAFLAAVSEALSADPPPHFDWTLTGPLVAESLLGAAVLDDLGRLIPVMVLVLCVALALLVRSPGGLLVVSAEIVLVLVGTFAALAICGQPLTLVTAPLPVVLLAMAISDEIHVLERFQPLLAEALALGREPRAAVVETLSATLAQLCRPLVATTLTTCAGLSSFVLSGLPALRVFGAASAFGIALALLATFTLVPALIAVLPPRLFLRIGAGRRTRRRSGAAPDVLAAAALRHPLAAALVALVAVGLALPGLARLRVGDNWLDNLGPQSGPVVADQAFNRHFWGAYRVDVVLEGRPDLFHHPAGARIAEEAVAIAAGAPGASGALSYLDPLQVVMQAHGEEGPASSLSPDRLADYAVLAAMAEDPGGAGARVTPDGSLSRIELLLKGEDYDRDRALLRHLGTRLDRLTERHGIGYHFSGGVPKGLQMVREVVRHQLVSVAMTYALVALIVLAFYARFADGVVVLAPIAASALVVFGVMGYAGVRLGIATSMFASLTTAIGVDFGLHLASGWRDVRGRPEAAAVAFAAAGRAVRWNAMVLAAGFSVLALSALPPNRSLGSLLALGISAAYLLTVLLLPALLSLRRTMRGWASRRADRLALGPTARHRARTAALLLGVAAAVSLAAPAAGGEPGEAGTALMAAVEEDFRSSPRAVLLEIVTTRPPGATSPLDPPREEVALWGVVASEGPETHVLFVFVAPRRLAGTGLLLRSRSGDPAGDQMWYRMRTFDRFRRIPRTSLKLRVPGTALTYEDAHGFLSANRYGFAAAGGAAAADHALLVALPRLPELARDLGFSSVEVAVDRSRHLVTRLEMRGAEERPLRRYRVETAHRFGDVWLPERARLEDVASGVVSEMTYRYWRLEPVPRELFTTEPDTAALLDRLRSALTRAGIEMERGPATGAGRPARHPSRRSSP